MLYSVLTEMIHEETFTIHTYFGGIRARRM